jgi:phosphoglycerate dehydrogenase-like enzyme
MSPPPLVIRCRENIADRLRALSTDPRLSLRIVRETERVWEFDTGVDVLITQSSDWKQAPETAPPGWGERLRWLHVLSAGIDGYPRWIFEGVSATCGRGSSSVAIAEYVMAAIVHHEKNFSALLAGSYAQWGPRRPNSIAGKTVGLLGLGAIGREVARRLIAFDVEVIALKRSPAPAIMPGIRMVSSLEELLQRSDHLVMALPLTAETRGIVNAEALRHSRPGQHIINVSRGPLIVDDALLDALDSGRLAAATLDVTYPEPLPEGHPFYAHEKIRLTPHISWFSDQGDRHMLDGIQANIDRLIAGQPLANLVDLTRGY